ncbi:MAG: DUF4349 domain-containing protein [Planctomycetota bacterium]|jgi:hypothetical protein
MHRFKFILFYQLIVLICISGCQDAVWHEEFGNFSADQLNARPPVVADIPVASGAILPQYDHSPKMRGGMGGLYARRQAKSKSPVALSVVELAGQTQQTERVLIYNAQLEISVSNIEASLAKVQQIAKENNGYLQSMSSNSITIRIPAKKFFDILEQSKQFGQILNKKIDVQDVTEKFIDLKLRLENAQALHKRLLTLLEKAQKVKDMLEVEKELNRVGEEIERIKGQLTRMEKQIRFSTIIIQFVQASESKVARRRPQMPFAWLDRLGVEQVLQIRQ